MSLRERSIQIIKENQGSSGAYIASPNFPVYQYCWLRDGSFIAHAMDRMGEHESSAAFFRWVGRTISRFADKAEKAIQQAQRGDGVVKGEGLHTRFTLEGFEGQDDWWNFQLDGYGTWLWALAEHVRRTEHPEILESIAPSVELTIRYLAALWQHPSYDCWEEDAESQNPYTLAAIYGGFRAAESLEPWVKRLDELGCGDLASAIKEYTITKGAADGSFVKSFKPPQQGGMSDKTTSNEVDASLVGLATPYGLADPGNEHMRNTIARIEEELSCAGGGVHRFLTDTYFGGGEWPLLAAWLGWHYAELGEQNKAIGLRDWVERQATESGELAEQVSTHLLAPDCYQEWVDRWGPVARPLLWSHAMYLILEDTLA